MRHKARIYRWLSCSRQWMAPPQVRYDYEIRPGLRTFAYIIGKLSITAPVEFFSPATRLTFIAQSAARG